jgi:hypothetical protein
MLHCRARSVDVSRFCYYDALYAFNVQRGDFRQGDLLDNL